MNSSTALPSLASSSPPPAPPPAATIDADDLGVGSGGEDASGDKAVDEFTGFLNLTKMVQDVVINPKGAAGRPKLPAQDVNSITSGARTFSETVVASSRLIAPS